MANGISSDLAVRGTTTNDPFEKLPKEIRDIIRLGLDLVSDCRAQEASKVWRTHVAAITDKMIATRSILQFLIDRSGLPQQSALLHLDRYIKVAQKMKAIVEGRDQGHRYCNESFSRDIEFLRREFREGMRTDPFTYKDGFLGLKRLVKELNEDDFIVPAMLLKDEKMFNLLTAEPAVLEILDSKLVDFAAYACLLQGQGDKFRKLLQQTSLFFPDPEQPIGNADYKRSQDVLEVFLLLAAEMNQMDIFKELLQLEISFDVNETLYKLVKMNKGEAIRELFANARANQKINLAFYANHGLNERQGYGLHYALMQAVNQNKQEAIDAILTLPDIDRQILEHVKDLIENRHSEPRNENYRREGWQDRTANPRRREIAAQLTLEIRRRFPRQREEAAGAQEQPNAVQRGGAELQALHPAPAPGADAPVDEPPDAPAAAPIHDVVRDADAPVDEQPEPLNGDEDLQRVLWDDAQEVAQRRARDEATLGARARAWMEENVRGLPHDVKIVIAAVILGIFCSMYHL